MRTAEPDIRSLFKPKSIAVIGASRRTCKIGYKILDNIVSGGYPGRIYPVNSRGRRSSDFRVQRRSRVEGEVDIGVIAVPAKFVFAW